MRVYFYYSLLTVIFISVALVLVVADSNHCDLVSNDHTAQRVGADFACGLVSFLLFAVVLAVLAIFMYMTHIVWQMKELLGQRETSQTFVLDDRLVESKMHQQSMGGKGHADYGAGSARAGHLGMDGSGAAGRYGEGADGERAERGAGGFGLSGGKLDGMLGLDEDEPTGMLESMGLAGGCSGATAAGGPSGAGSSYQGGRGRGGLDASGRPLDFHGASGRFTATGRPEHPEWAVAPSGPQPGWGQIPIRSKEEPQ